MTAEIARLSQLNVERLELIEKHNQLTADHKNLISVKKGLDIHIFDLNAKIFSLEKWKADMIALLAKRDAEIVELNKIKSDQTVEIA